MAAPAYTKPPGHQEHREHGEHGQDPPVPVPTPIVSEEGGVWMVRILAPTDELAVQEYRCATEDVARAFAARFLSPRAPPPAHGSVARSRGVESGPWWWRKRR